MSLTCNLYVFGIASNPSVAINISWNLITSTVLPFATYDRTMFPIMKPIATPIFPNLFSNPAIIPDIA